MALSWARPSTMRLPIGALCAFLDRLFYMKSGAYAYKPAAAVVSLPPWRGQRGF